LSHFVLSFLPVHKITNVVARGVDPATARTTLPSVHAAVIPTAVFPTEAGTTFNY
jgi:hypothetical protein